MNSATATPQNLEAYLDLPVTLTVELGACLKPTRDVLRLGVGSVVELDRRTWGPVNLYVERKLVAKGEIVMENGELAIKITAIVR